MRVSSSQIQYEYRTKKDVAAAVFGSPDLAEKWLEQWKLKNPKYAESLTLVKVTTHTLTEAV